MLYAAGMTKDIKPRVTDLQPADPQYPIFLTPSAFGRTRDIGARIGADHDQLRAVAEIVRPINAKTADIVLHGITFIIRNGSSYRRNIWNWDDRWNEAAQYDTYFSAAELPNEQPTPSTKLEIARLGFPVLEFMLTDLDEPTGGTVAGKMLEPEHLGRFASLAERAIGHGLAARAAQAIQQAEDMSLYPIGVAMPEDA
jgi:hypothetical protein